MKPLTKAFYWMIHNVQIKYKAYTPQMKYDGIGIEDAPENFRAPFDNEIEIYAMFPQLWGSTALGFPGMGGSAMTPAYTIVISCQHLWYVFFDGRFAYTVKKNCNTEAFKKDMDRRCMVPVGEEGRYCCDGSSK